MSGSLLQCVGWERGEEFQNISQATVIIQCLILDRVGFLVDNNSYTVKICSYFSVAKLTVNISLQGTQPIATSPRSYNLNMQRIQVSAYENTVASISRRWGWYLRAFLYLNKFYPPVVPGLVYIHIDPPLEVAVVESSGSEEFAGQI